MWWGRVRHDIFSTNWKSIKVDMQIITMNTLRARPFHSVLIGRTTVRGNVIDSMTDPEDT
jgi:hypothetical protein